MSVELLGLLHVHQMAGRRYDDLRGVWHARVEHVRDFYARGDIVFGGQNERRPSDLGQTAESARFERLLLTGSGPIGP